MMLPQKRVIATFKRHSLNRLSPGGSGVGHPVTNAILGHRIFCRAKRQNYQVYWQEPHNRIIVPAYKFKVDVVPASLIPTCHTDFEHSQSLNEFHVDNNTIFQTTSKRHSQGCVRKLSDSVC